MGRAVQALSLKLLLRILQIHKLDRLYLHAVKDSPCADFAGSLLKALDVDIDLQGSGLKEVPRAGKSAVVVANHPFGGLEAIVLAAVLGRVRPDVRFLANSLLASIPELRELIIPVNPFGGQEAKRTNVQGAKAALKWLGKGGMLCVFPAGEVAHWQMKSKTVTDPDWQINATRLIRRSGADVLPVFFPGCNTRSFHYAGLVHPRLRTALLPSQLLNKRGSRITVCPGRLIQSAVLRQLPSDEVATWYLRARTYGLDSRKNRHKGCPKLFPGFFLRSARQAPVAPALDREALQSDVARLPRGQFLVSSGELTVFEARAGQMPHLLHEIGRLRETTFRQEGEGTDRPLDLDMFDQTYDHLVLWDTSRHEVVGAYRIGRVDELLRRRRGDWNLYTSTLFRFKPGFFRAFSNSLELGRSFIVPEHQRSYAPLLLLWKGIGQYICRRPAYRFLFGPVSISQDYADVSIQSLISHLNSKFYQPVVGLNVQGKRTPKFKIKRNEREMIESISILDTPVLDDIIAGFEADGRRMPILLKQYLKLGGKIAGFHHDRRFGSFDGLIVVDLLQTDPRFLKRFMGRAEAESYLAGQQRAPSDLKASG
jgi:putative hemolysin